MLGSKLVTFAAAMALVMATTTAKEEGVKVHMRVHKTKNSTAVDDPLASVLPGDADDLVMDGAEWVSSASGSDEAQYDEDELIDDEYVTVDVEETSSSDASSTGSGSMDDIATDMGSYDGNLDGSESGLIDGVDYVKEEWGDLVWYKYSEEDLCAEIGATPSSVEGVEGTFCVWGTPCSGDVDGDCPFAVDGVLEDGAVCTKLDSGIMGCQLPGNSTEVEV